MKHKTESFETDRVIYHYCDASALLSILQQKKLRFTHAAYLNDTLEIQHGVGICKTLLADRLERRPSDPVLEHIIQYLDNAELWQYYVCCFSESNDKLSQWRAYANDGGGFAIGFHARAFHAGTDGLFECHFKRIEYKDDAITKKVEELIDAYSTEAHVFTPDATEESKQHSYAATAANVGNLLIDESVFIKNTGFSEEQEWRAVRSYKFEDSDIERALVSDKNPGPIVRIWQELQQAFIARRLVRQGRYGLTPYIEVEFQPESLREIVCGPRTTPKLTETSLAILRKKYDLIFNISRSAATYR